MKDRTAIRCMVSLLTAAMLVAVMVASAAAVQSPSGCNASTLELTLSRSTGVAVPGQMVTFGVTVAVPATDGSGVPACDTQDVTITAQCPDADNTIPPTTTPQILVTDADYLAGTPPTPIGSIMCAMPDVPVNKAVSAYSQASGLLLDTELLAGSPFTRSNTITVTVTPCEVKVDKQVSCDGGQTWFDQGLVLANNDGNDPCSVIGQSGPVQVRYQAQNTSASCLLTACVLTETNATFGTPPAVGTIVPGTTTDFLPAANAPACSDAYGDPQTPNEPNTVEITCQTGGDPVTASDLAAFNCLSVDATVDRAVYCEGDAGFADQTMVRMNEDGTLGCTAVDGEDVIWEYAACNEGTAPLYDCTLVDQNLLVSGPIVVGNLAPSACSSGIPADNNPVLCSNELELSETPDQGKVTLTCCTKDNANIAECTEANRVTVYDVSTVTCSTPSGLNAIKECVDDNGDGTDDNVRVVASATAGDVGFVNCTASDILYRAGECPATGDGDPIPLTTEGGAAYPFSLAPEASQGLFGTIDPALTNDACNTASVTCQVDGTGEEVTAIAPPVTCNFEENEGCVTRTPGFWGTHPAFTANYLNVEVCGTTIDNVNAGNGTSSTEAMCSVGQDSKIRGPQKTQLVRQCTAAALNIAASLAEGGNCAADSNIAEVFDACCDAESRCTGDDTGYSLGDCIFMVDEFNNNMDTFYPEAFMNPGPARPKKCQDSKNNGIVVFPTP